MITFLEAKWIRERVASGESQVELAKELDVRPSTICQIVSRKRLGTDLERKSIELQLRNAERAYEAVQKRDREFNERRKREQEKIDRRKPSPLHRAEVNREPCSPLQAVAVTGASLPVAFEQQ
jgi:hypothetical protein